MHGGYSEVYGQSIQMKLRTSSIHIDIIWDQADFPVVHDSFVSEKAKRGLAPLGQKNLSVLDFFGVIERSVSSIVSNAESNCFPCFLCVGDSENANFDFPSEGAIFVALETWHQYVSSSGTHAGADLR